MTQSPRRCQQEIKNTELNACVILASSNVPNTETIEPNGDKRTQSTSKKGYTYIRSTELNACGISASSDVPSYNMQHPIHIETNIILVAK